MVRSLIPICSARLTAVTLSDASCNCLATASFLSRAIVTSGRGSLFARACLIPALTERSSSADCFISTSMCSLCPSTWVRNSPDTVWSSAFRLDRHFMSRHRKRIRPCAGYFVRSFQYGCGQVGAEQLGKFAGLNRLLKIVTLSLCTIASLQGEKLVASFYPLGDDL